MPRGHSDGVRVPTARPFFFYFSQILQVILWREGPEKLRNASLGQPNALEKGIEKDTKCVLKSTECSSRRKWIDAGENPAVRHEGVPPSNNLIKDGTHRATVFVGPTLKSFSFCFRQIDSGLYGGDISGDQENS